MATSFGNPIFSALGGFFSTSDNFRHAIIGTTEGKVFEIFFNPQQGKGQAYLACFDHIVTADAFYTPDDNFAHVVAVTPNGDLSEIFYNQTGTFFSEPPLANFTGVTAVSGFYTADDTFRHVIVATNDGNLTEVFYGPQIGVHISEPPLANFSGIVGIAGFYTSDDGYRHVIVATGDGGVSEVFYSPNTGSFVSRPPLGVFVVDAPALEDISPDVSNLDANATAVLDANQISTAGRSVSIAGSASELFVFNEKSGVWINTGGLNWSQLPDSLLVTNWSLVVATTESGAQTSGGNPPAVHIHPDIWDFLIDTSVGGKKAWVAGDGGVYEITLVNPFTFPESDGWIRRFGGMHTHQAHMITVIPTNPVNRSRLAYPTGDNEGWYRNANMLVTPAPGWEVTHQNGNLGDANWSAADASSPRFILIVRNEELAAFINYNASPDIKFVSFLNFWKKKDQNGNVQVLGGHFYPGPTSFYFIQSPARSGRFSTLDAVMMCDLPLIRYNPVTDTNDIMLPNTPLGQNTNGQPVLLRNSNFDANPDINVSNAVGWTIELSSFPPDTLGCYVTGSRGLPIYYSFTSNTLSRWDGASWITVANNVVASQAFGPAFVNPYDVSVLYIVTSAGIQVSNDGGNTFNADSQLTALVAGSQNLPMTTLVQIAFNYNNPAEIVAGATSGVFYRNAAGRWADLTYLLPRPLSFLTGVGIDCEALYVSFDSRSIVRLIGYRNA